MFWFIRQSHMQCVKCLYLYFFIWSFWSGMENVQKKTFIQLFSVHACVHSFFLHFSRFTGMNLSINHILNVNLWMCVVCAYTSYLLMIWYPKHFIKIDHKVKNTEKKPTIEISIDEDPYNQSVNRTTQFDYGSNYIRLYTS